MASKKKDYDENSIQVLKGVEHIKLRPGMYIHDTASDGLHQLIKEVLDNSIDEFMGGHVKLVQVHLDTKAQTVTIADDGRGIPVGKHKKTGKSTLTTIFTETGAGGKFDKGAYSVSAGLHGVGVTVVNALTESTECWVARPEGSFYQSFSYGVPDTAEPTKKMPETKKTMFSLPKKHGTMVRFKPDTKIFGKSKFKPKILTSWIEEQSYLCRGLQIQLWIDDKMEEYQSDAGLTQYVADSVAEEEVGTAHKKPVVYEDDSIECVLQWTDDKEEYITSFVNSSHTPEGGTQVTGLKKAITQAFKANISGKVNYDDLRVGLYAALHIKVLDPIFKGQTKSRLLNKESEKVVYDALLPVLEKFVAKNQKTVKAIVNRAEQLHKARSKFQADVDATKSIVTYKAHKKGVLPGKLAEAPFCKPEERELFICEGESAAGTAKRARNPKFQEVLPLKGKIPNASKFDMVKLLKNDEIQAIITAIGAGFGDKCDPKKARVGKVMLLMDADPDGQHIAALVLSFLTNWMRPVLEEGLVYVVDSPLFVASNKDVRCFGHTLDEATDAFTAEAKKNATPLISRLKGHGESSPDELKDYAMNDVTRKLFNVEIGDEDDDLVMRVMGPGSGFRKVILGIVDAVEAS